jgi:L-ascorbate oxidase
LGQVIEFVVQNNRAGRFGGEYNSTNNITSARGGREQHPFHLHGHRFWVVGTGNGTWDESKVAEYNLADPVYRDTATVFSDGAATADTAGWVALRFVTENPGAWPFHCHILWHQFMGQQVNVIAGVPREDVGAPPEGMPQCPAKCRFNHALYTPKLTGSIVGAAYVAPENSNESN